MNNPERIIAEGVWESGYKIHGDSMTSSVFTVRLKDGIRAVMIEKNISPPHEGFTPSSLKKAIKEAVSDIELYFGCNIVNKEALADKWIEVYHGKKK